MSSISFDRVIRRKGFDFILTVDCEGTNFDRNLEKNVINLEKHLELATKNNVYTVLFITPYFADMLFSLNLVEKIRKNYKVVFGLHIHPDNLPSEILEKCPFIRGEKLLSSYSYKEQYSIITNCVKYLKKRNITPEGFRGGYFSINDDTERILYYKGYAKWESHNIFREEYVVSEPILYPLPVYTNSNKEEFRLEDFNSKKLIEMVKAAAFEDRKVTAITHSYLFYDKDFHYERDNIDESIYDRLEKVLKEVKPFRTCIPYANPVNSSSGGLYLHSYRKSIE